MRGTRNSPIPIDDSEEEVLEELCDKSADSAIADGLSTRLMIPPSPETYASTSHKRKRDEIRTDYSDAFIQGSSSMPLAPVGESKKARKRRRRLELQALEAAEMLARAQAQKGWYNQMSNFLYGSAGDYDRNVDMNMTMFHGMDGVPAYSTEDNMNVMRSYSQNASGPSEWVSAMALAGSLPDPNGYSNQYQWPPPNGHSYSHNFHVQPFAPPSRSPSPPALLERVSSPILPTVNRLLPMAPNAHSITAKRTTQTIGMKPDNEPHSKHGTFRFSPGNLSFFLNNNNQNPGYVGNLTITNQHSYIPNPACTIVMEQLPKSHRTIEFVKSWAKQSSDVMPVCILVDAPSAKALVEFPSAKFSRKAWESPRLGAEYMGLKTHQLKGKPRVDQIKVWWYRVDGVGAGAGVGEIEEGEIGDDEVDGQEQRFGHQIKQQQRQGQQDPPKQPESKKARKARLAREKQAKQGIQPISSQQNRNLSGSGLGHGMTELSNASASVALPELPIPLRRSPQLLRAVNWKNLAQPDLQADKQLEEVSRSPLSRHHRGSSSFRSNLNRGNAGISTPTPTDVRAEVGPRHWRRDTEVTVESNSGRDSIAFSKEEPGDATSARVTRRRSASFSSAADQMSAVTKREQVTSTGPPSPSSSTATSTILQLSELPQSFQGSQGTSPIDITQSINKPFPSSGPSYSTDAAAIATSTSAIVAPSLRILPKLPLSPLTRQPVPSAQPRATVSSVSTASPLESAVKGMTPSAKAKAIVSQLNPVPVAVALNNLAPTIKPSPIPISIPAPLAGETQGSEPRIAASEQVSSDVTPPSGFTKLAEMKRALMAKQKDLEETIARSKVEMTRLKESASVEPKGEASVSSSSAEGNKAMEDRLRKLVLQSQRTRGKNAEYQRSVLPQSRASSTSTSGVSSTIPSPPVLTPPLSGADNIVHTMSPVQTFSLEDLAVSFITETISTLKQTATPTLVSSPIAQSPSVSLVPVVPTSRPQLQPQSQPQPQSQVAAPVLSSGQTTIKEELAARQQQLEQYIAESRVLMTQLTQARTKQEKDRLLGLMREKTRLMDEEKEKMANVANGTDQATSAARGLDEQKQASKAVMFMRWPTCSLDAGVLIISDDEYDEDEDEG